MVVVGPNGPCSNVTNDIWSCTIQEAPLDSAQVGVVWRSKEDPPTKRNVQDGWSE